MNDYEVLIREALAAVEPETAVHAAVRAADDSLWIGDHAIDIDGRRVVALAIGKAAVAMMTGLADVLGDTLAEGLIVAKHPPDRVPERCRLLIGEHPVPGEGSLAAGSAVLQFVEELGELDLLVCLISGGGSSLAVAPCEGVSIDDYAELTQTLVHSGVTIDEINTVRRRLDRLKGGGLAAMAAPADVVSLVLSDVVGDPLEAIASGPTFPDPTSAEDALAVLEKIGVPTGSDWNALQQAPAYDVPSVEHVIVGSCGTAARAAADEAEVLGYTPHLLDLQFTGEAREVGERFARRLVEFDGERPACLIAAGESTVTLSGDGLGGRNLEVALAAVDALAGHPDLELVTFATDGDDGPTDAAGARVDGHTYERARALGLDPADFLERNDSYHFFEKVGGLIKTGPTGTNVNDLILMFAR
jgi:hydroxypyruvate reductase